MASKQTYVVAVSGGVDSVVLLHLLASRRPERISYVVAHFDHGIRSESAEDEKFVKSLAKRYGFDYASTRANLGKDASEAEAREARYAFLREVAKQYKAEKIITAHHQDDLVGTMIINILRGTGPRGLAVMQSSSDVIRPLLNKRKKDLLTYAKKHKLTWREDSTNQDTRYLRNYVRINILPKLGEKWDYFVKLNRELANIYHDIDTGVSVLLHGQLVLSRTRFVILPVIVQQEVMRRWLLKSGVSVEDKKMIERATIAAKTLPIGKRADLDGQHWLVSQKQNLSISTK